MPESGHVNSRLHYTRRGSFARRSEARYNYFGRDKQEALRRYYEQASALHTGASEPALLPDRLTLENLDRPAQDDVSFHLNVSRLEKIDGVRLSMEGIWEMWHALPNSVLEGGTTRVCIADIVLNPDHETLGSFVRDDVGNDTWGWIVPHHQIKYTWPDGEFLPQFDTNAIDNIRKIMKGLQPAAPLSSGDPISEMVQSLEREADDPNALDLPERPSDSLSRKRDRGDPEPTEHLKVEKEIASYEGDARSERRRPSHPHCGLYCVYAMTVLLDTNVSFASLVKPEYLGYPEGSLLRELC